MRPASMLAALVVAALSATGAAAQAAPRRMVLVPEAAVTAEDGPSAVTDVADIAVGRDGRLYVVQGQGRAVLVLSPDGRPIRTLGRAGRGPGEFIQPPSAAGWRGDTLVVADPHGRRLVAFLADGRVAFTRDYAGIERFLPRMLLADGQSLGERQAFSEEIATGQRTSLDLLATVAVSGPARTIARLPLRHHTARMAIGSGAGQRRTYFAQPYADADLFDVDPLGRWVVSVAGPAAVGPGRSVFSLAWRSSGGAVRTTTTVPYIPLKLQPDAVRETRRLWGEMLGELFAGEPRGRLTALVREAVFVPAYYPPVTAVMAGNDGSTWVRRAGPGDTATWMVFDARGRQLAYVSAPASVALHAATATHAWGVSTNANDVPIVTRFRLQAQGAR